MTKQLIIRSGSVAADSILPKFNDVFPSLVPPNKRKYIDLFDGQKSALTGRSLPVVPAGLSAAWLATSALEVTGAGGVKPTNTTSEGRGLFNAGGAGGQGEWGATFVAGTMGAFGIIIRCALDTQESWRAIFGSTGMFGIYRVNASGQNTGAQVEIPMPAVAGQRYTIRVVAEGLSIKAYVNDALVVSIATADLSANQRVGLLFRNTDAECREFTGGN